MNDHYKPQFTHLDTIKRISCNLRAWSAFANRMKVSFSVFSRYIYRNINNSYAAEMTKFKDLSG